MRHFISGSRGVTLVELLIVISVIGILAVALGFEFGGWMGKYKIESQVKELHADLQNARVRALQRGRDHFVVISSASYQTFEDTNESGGAGPGAGDTQLWTAAKAMGYPSLWTSVVVMRVNGLVSPNSSIRFNTGDKTPDIDCISLSSTRINLGKWSSIACVEK